MKIGALSLLLLACGGGAVALDPDGSAPAKDGSSEATTGDGGGQCCPPDPSPGCCMAYGGWSSSGQCFGKECDGMPQPNDPGWKLVKDDHGCSTWFNPAPMWGANACGAPTMKDASVDAPSKD